MCRGRAVRTLRRAVRPRQRVDSAGGRGPSTIPEGVGAWTITGDAGALVRVLATGIREVEDTVERMRATDRGERTRTVIGMTRLLDRPAK